jgi:hypothetical protein
MSKDHLSRKDLRHDELQDALVGAQHYISDHQRETKKWVAIAVGAVVLIGLIWGGISWRNKRLSMRLSNALALYEVPLATGTEKPVGNLPVFKTEKERKEAVAKELRALATDAPGSSAGKSAGMMLLSMEGQKELTADRIGQLQALASSRSGSITGGFAAAAAIDAKAAEGKTKEAIELGRKYLDSSSSPIPKDQLLFMIAQLYEKNSQPAEAKTFYQRIVNEFPRSSVRVDAQQRIAGL